MRRCVILVLAAATLATPAHGTSVGVGVFGGASIPVVQDDNGTGTQFGIRVPITLIPLVSIEPYLAHTGAGDASQSFGGFEYTRSGYEIDAYGVNVALGSLGMLPGFPLYPYVGIASHKLTRDGSNDISEVGYNFGLGLGFSIPPGVALNLRGELNAVQTGDTSRKFANVNLGVAYKFFNLP